MHSVFETGKKYQNELGQISTCLFADSEIVVMRWENNRHVFQRHPEDLKYFGLIPYVLPRKEHFNAFRGPFGVEYGNPHNSKELADKAISDNKNYYGRLIMTHHSETEVTVEFHLNRQGRVSTT